MKIKKIVSFIVVLALVLSAASMGMQAFADGVYGVPSDLQAELNDIYDDYNFSVGWGLYDISGSSLKEVASYNADKVFQSNCTIKAAMLMYICKLMDQGKLSKSTMMTVDNSKMHYSGLLDGEYSVDFLLTQMIRVSNSAPFEVFHRYVTTPVFNSFLASLGSGTRMTSYSFMGTCTPKNRAIEWLAIYKYCHSNADNANYCWWQFNTAKYSPIRDGLRFKIVAHKGGWYYKEGLRGSAGDCAIVKTRNGGCYLVVIFTQNREVGNYSKEFIGKIACVLDDVWNSYYRSLDTKTRAKF